MTKLYYHQQSPFAPRDYGSQDAWRQPATNIDRTRMIEFREIWTMRYLVAVAATFICLASRSAALGEERGVPKKFADFLAATEKEAAIPLWDLEYEPNTSLVFGTFGETLRIGKIGFVPKIDVHQILDGNSARVALRWRSPLRYRTEGPNGKEFYKFGDVSEENVIVKRIPTSGMVDDATYKIDKVLEVIGTEKYTTAVGGTKTVFVLAPLEIEPFKHMFAEAAVARIKAADAAKAKAADDVRAAGRDELQRQLTRTWSDLSGKFTTTGQLIEILAGPGAKIQKEDGSTIEVKLNQMSRRDREWILNEGKTLLSRLQSSK